MLTNGCLKHYLYYAHGLIWFCLCLSDIPLNLSILLHVIVWIKYMRWNTTMESWQFPFFFTVYRKCIYVALLTSDTKGVMTSQWFMPGSVAQLKVVRMWLHQKQELKDCRDRDTSAPPRRRAAWCHWLLQVAHWAGMLFVLEKQAPAQREKSKNVQVENTDIQHAPT